MATRLRIITGQLAGHEVSLDDVDAVRIGRDPDSNDLAFPPGSELRVSRNHARLERRDGGLWFLTDLDSANGTFVNGRRVNEQELRNGDEIELGPRGPRLRFDNVASVPETIRVGPSADTTAASMTVVSVYREEKERGGSTTEVFRRTLGNLHAVQKQRSRRALVLVSVGAIALVVGVWAWGESRGRALEARGRAEAARIEQEAQERIGETQAALERERQARAESEAAYRAALDVIRSEQRRETAALRSTLGFSEDLADQFRRGVGLVVFRIALVDPQTDEAVVDAGYVTGTAFLVHEAGWLLTNRHLVDPSYDRRIHELAARASQQTGRSLTSRFTDYEIFFPGQASSFQASVSGFSTDADVGLLRLERPPSEVPVLPLGRPSASPRVGQRVGLIGFPAGLRLLLNRLTPDQIARIGQEAGTTELTLARALAGAGEIWPLVNTGELSDQTDERFAYTLLGASVGGSSGSPVFGAERNVVAVHFAGFRNSGSGDDSGGLRVLYGAPIEYGWAVLPDSVRQDLERRAR